MAHTLDEVLEKIEELVAGKESMIVHWAYPDNFDCRIC